MSISNGESISVSVPQTNVERSSSEGFNEDSPLGQPVVKVEIVGEDTRPTKMNMLIAEDALVNQQALRFFFDDGQTDLTFVENGQLAIDAVKAAEAANHPFDVLLMDMVMPVMDGYEATTTLRELGYNLPIIALTGDGTEEDRKACVDAGCTDYASKAVDLDVLLGVIERLTLKH